MTRISHPTLSQGTAVESDSNIARDGTRTKDQRIQIRLQRAAPSAPRSRNALPMASADLAIRPRVATRRRPSAGNATVGQRRGPERSSAGSGSPAHAVADQLRARFRLRSALLLRTTRARPKASWQCGVVGLDGTAVEDAEQISHARATDQTRTRRALRQVRPRRGAWFVEELLGLGFKAGDVVSEEEGVML